VLTAIGESYRGLSELDRAETVLRRAVTVGGLLPDRGAAPTIRGRALLGLGLVQSDRGDAAGAASTLQLAEASATGAVPVDSALLGHILMARGDNQQYRGDLDGAEVTQRRALGVITAVHGDSAVETAEALNNLAVLLGQRGRWTDAEPLHRQALDIVARRRGANHPDVAAAYNSLAMVTSELGQLATAEGYYRHALRIRRSALGPDHQELAWTYTNLGYVLLDLARPSEALEQADSTAAMRARGALTADHPMVASALVLRGRALLALDRALDAQAPLTQALTARRASLPENHWLLAQNESLLGEAIVRSGDRVEGERLLTRGYEGLRRERGPDHPLTKQARERLDRLRQPRP
jgi:tetratricopeptide (TPR) repeat protein